MPGTDDVARVLVLAGRRIDEGERGSCAQPKALVEVDGVPMLERVLACVHAALPGRPVFVSGDPALLEATPRLASWRLEGWLHHHASGISPAASVADFLAGAGPGASLVTTADHPLLTPEAIAQFRGGAAASGADLAVGVVLASRFRPRFPAVRRTFVPLRDDGVTGANLFLFRTPAAQGAARFWRRAEALRKRPWRLVSLFGPVALLRFLARRMDVAEAERRVSAAIGVRVAVVPLADPACAIDVDSAADLAAAARVLAERRGAVAS